MDSETMEISSKDVGEISPNVIELAKKLQANREKREAQMREAIAAKHPHALPDTLTFDESAKKYKVQIECTETGEKGRWVYTSDLHQVDVSIEISEKRKSEKKAKKAEELKAARALLRQQAAANQG
jgi:hypothetical protein